MAKKQRDDTPNVSATSNRDVIQRLNFLYQASVYLQSIAPVVQGNSGVKHANAETEKSQKNRTKRRKTTSKATTHDLARSYVQCMHIVGQKTTVKIDPSLKRSICTGCSTTLVPGSSASIRIRGSHSHGHIMAYTCLHCRTTKRIPASSSSAHPPALATRTDAGHVVFCGNQQLPVGVGSDENPGTCFALRKTKDIPTGTSRFSVSHNKTRG